METAASTADSFVYDSSMEHSGESEQTPFLKRELLYVQDQNGNSDYSRNQIVFESQAMANNGLWSSWSESFVTIPTIVEMYRDAHHETANIPHAIKWKSGCILIDSIIVEINNSVVVQERRDVSAYCSYKQHTQWSLDDVNTKGDTWQYKKPSREWAFEAGRGLISADVGDDTITDEYDFKSGADAGVVSAKNLEESGADYYEQKGNSHLYYKDVRLRLKDIILFESMPMLRGASVKITLSLNQGSVTTTYADSAGGAAPGLATAGTSVLRGSAFPIIRCLPTTTAAAYVETINVAVGQLTDAAGTVRKGQKQQARLYVPTYTMVDRHELAYLQKQTQKVLYRDVYIKTIRDNAAGQSFQHTITNSMSRMKRLIVVPMLSKSASGACGRRPSDSPFCSEPSTCSPHFLSDIQVSLSGSNVYQSSIVFKYENFLQEMAGRYGVNGSMTDGVTSSLISMKDFDSGVFGYISVDLSRRLQYDDMTALSLEFKGKVNSPLPLDFLVYVEHEKDFTMDLATGAML